MPAVPNVSVAVPVFNGARHLRVCLDSVLQQSFSDFELVISDGGSTDDSVSIVSQLKDHRTVLLPAPSSTLDLYSNWERAIAHCSGAYVKLLCQDDLLLPDCLSVQVESLRAHPNAGLTANRRAIIDDRDSTLMRSRGIGQLARTLEPTEVGAERVVAACVRAGGNLLGEPACVTFRRAALPSPLVSTRWTYPIDLDMYLRCLEGGWLAVFDRRIEAAFRVTPYQLSARLALQQASEMRSYLREISSKYPGHVSSLALRRGLVTASLLAVGRNLVYDALRIRRVMHPKRVAASTNSQ